MKYQMSQFLLRHARLMDLHCPGNTADKGLLKVTRKLIINEKSFQLRQISDS